METESLAILLEKFFHKREQRSRNKTRGGRGEVKEKFWSNNRTKQVMTLYIQSYPLCSFTDIYPSAYLVSPFRCLTGESGISIQMSHRRVKPSSFLKLRCNNWLILALGTQLVIQIFTDYTPFIVIKYWLYSLGCTIYPCINNLFILYIVVCASWSLTPILSLPLFPLTSNQ